MAHAKLPISSVVYLGPNGDLETDQDLLLRLSQLNGFTEADLAENRRRLIARSQVARLYSLALQPLRMSLCAALGWFTFLFVVRLLTPRLFLFTALGLSLVVWFAFISVGVVLAFLKDLIGSFVTVVDLICDIVQRKAICLEGRLCASVAMKKGRGMAALYGENVDCCSYAIGDEYLPVSPEACDALRPYSGSVFRVYLTPRSRLLLSLEPVMVRRADRLVK